MSLNNFTYPPRQSVKVGNIMIGGLAPIVVQSMTNTDTVEIVSTVEQIKQLCSVESIFYLST